ncbi:MAG: hypothetical protein IT317_10855 [Anaerolineales bacterium]|nr:hypothetical protein [Anaerolineales bacterium]
MKRAVSISLGSSKRNKAVEVELLGERVSIERIGTDGDMEAAAQKYKELDGKVDAFGVGGADLGLMVADKWYPLYSVNKMVRFVQQTPLADGTGLKNTLERRVVGFMEKHIAADLKPKRVMMTGGADRWGMSQSFIQGGFETVFCDLMFALDVPIPLRSEAAVKRLAALIMPIVGRLPFSWVYPIGEKQEKSTPKFGQWYAWATVIAGDCHYIKRYMPARLDGKIICTNTTTVEDVARFKATGVKHLVTTTPVMDGRSFGTNMLEAALIAVSGQKRKLSNAELEALIDRLGFEPTLQTLNP